MCLYGTYNINIGVHNMKNLRLIRETRKMTQQDVADILQIQRPTYTRYENGEREPDNNTLIKLCEIFNCSLDYLFGLNAENLINSKSNNEFYPIVEKYKKIK